MSSYQDLVSHYIRDSSKLSQSDDLPWKLLDRESVSQSIERSNYDVDFLSITGSAKEIVEDINIETLISAGRSKIFKKCSLKFLKGSLAKMVLIFAECGDYLLGMLIEDNIPVDSNEYTSVIDIEDDNIDACENLTSSKIYRRLINNRLLKANTNSIAYRDVLNFIKEYFLSDNLVLYRYGQKQRFQSCQEIITNLSKSYHVDVAIAIEMPYQDYFLSLGCGSSVPVKTKFYSNLLSNIACNFIIKSSNEAQSAIKNAYRVVGYNSIQHRKLEYQKKINFTDLDTFSVPEKMSTWLLPFFKNYYADILTLYTQNIDSNKLRIEAYCNVTTSFNMRQMILGIRSFLLEKCQVLYLHVDDVKSFIRYMTLSITKIFQKIPSNSFDNIIPGLILHEKLYTGVFSTREINDKWVSQNVYFGLQNELFEIIDGVPQLKLGSEVFSYFTANILPLFKESLQKEIALYIYMQQESLVMNCGNVEEEEEKIISKTIYDGLNIIFQKYGNRNNEKSKMVVNLIDFLKYAKNHFEQIYLKAIFVYLLTLQEENHNLFSRITSSFSRLELVKTDKIYLYDPQNMYNCFEIYQDLIRNNSFSYISNCWKLFFEGIMQENDRPVYNLASLKAFVENQTKTFLASKNKPEKYHFIDDDYFLRLCFVKVSTKNTDCSVTKMRYSFEYFDAFADFLKLLSLGVIIGWNCGTNMPKWITDRKDHITQLMTKYPGESTYTSAQLLFATGVFNLTNSKVGPYFPVKIKFSHIVPVCCRSFWFDIRNNAKNSNNSNNFRMYSFQLTIQTTAEQSENYVPSWKKFMEQNLLSDSESEENMMSVHETLDEKYPKI